MFIRATRMETSPYKLDEAIETFQKRVLPSARSVSGFFGGVLLADGKTGSVIEITYWETAEALSASDQLGVRTPTPAARGIAATEIVSVETYEIVILDRDQAPKPGELVRVNAMSGDPEKVDAVIVFVRDNVLPVLKLLKGYRAIVMGVDRQSGRSTVSTLWDTLADLETSERNVTELRRQTAHAAGADVVHTETFETRVFDFTPATPSES